MSTPNQPGPEVRLKVRERFLVPRQFVQSQIVEVINSAPKVISHVARAFLSNLNGALSTTCIPVTLAMASAQEWRFRQISIAEHILAGVEAHADPSDPAQIQAREQARIKWEEEIQSKDAINHMADMACEYLLQLYEQESVRHAADELLRQGIVLLWGAFECLARDLFVCSINSAPLLSKRLIDSPEGRRVFQLKAMDFETLAEHRFDISDKLGSILISHQDLSDLAKIRTVYGLLFPQVQSLYTALGNRNLWTMVQRRHLIVHNRGIVDQRYLDSTGDQLLVGDVLVVTPQAVEEYAAVVQDAGAALIVAVGGVFVNIQTDGAQRE